MWFCPFSSLQSFRDYKTALRNGDILNYNGTATHYQIQRGWSKWNNGKCCCCCWFSFLLARRVFKSANCSQSGKHGVGARRDDSNANDVNNEQMENVQKMLTSRFIFAFARLCIKPLQASDKQTNSALPAFLLEDSNNCHSIFFSWMAKRWLFSVLFCSVRSFRFFGC